jgi:D-amino-acid oxidase
VTKTDPFAHTLPPVKADVSRVLKTTVGLRPYRPDGFVIRAEPFGDKTLIHDYGHGGSGVSLCWGTAQMSLDLLGDISLDQAGVIGCGAVGLATARLLQRRGTAVTIYAAEKPPRTTTDLSGAFWAPFSLVDDNRMTPRIAERIVTAGRIAYAEFERMANSARYAIRRMPTYYLDDRPADVTPEERLMPDLFAGLPLGPGKHPFGDRHALVVHALAIEPSPHIRAVLEDFEESGGQFVRREFKTREEIGLLPERVVFNCSGLGSRMLANDDDLIPMKGQLTLLQPQPEIQYMIAVPKKRLYMIPRSDGIVLGTSQVRGNWSLEPDKAEVTRVIEGMKALRKS